MTHYKGVDMQNTTDLAALDHYPDNPSDFGDFDSPQRCVACREIWPCSSSGEDIGVKYNAGGTTEVGAHGDRCLIRISNTHLTIDHEVVIEGDPSSGYTLTAPFTTGMLMTTTQSRIHLRDQGATIDQHAILTRAHETGERSFQMMDFVAR